jgi:hypothetical protein
MLEDLGCGFPLYFEYKKFTFLIFLVMTLVFSIVALIFNISQDEGTQWVEDTDSSPIIDTTIGNYGTDANSYDDAELTAQAYLNFAAILIILVLINLLRKRQNKLKNTIDEKNLTPPDFTIYVINLPLDKTEGEIKAWFNEFDADLALDVQKVNKCYDIKEIIDVGREADKWQKMKNYVIHYRKMQCLFHKVTEDEARNKGIDIDPPNVDYDY